MNYLWFSLKCKFWQVGGVEARHSALLTTSQLMLVPNTKHVSFRNTKLWYPCSSHDELWYYVSIFKSMANFTKYFPSTSIHYGFYSFGVMRFVPSLFLSWIFKNRFLLQDIGHSKRPSREMLKMRIWLCLGASARVCPREQECGLWHNWGLINRIASLLWFTKQCSEQNVRLRTFELWNNMQVCNLSHHTANSLQILHILKKLKQRTEQHSSCLLIYPRLITYQIFVREFPPRYHMRKLIIIYWVQLYTWKQIMCVSFLLT